MKGVFEEFAIVNAIDDGVGCGGEFIGVILTKGVTAKIAMSMIVVVMMVGGGCGPLGGSVVDLVHPGWILPSWSEDVQKSRQRSNPIRGAPACPSKA